MNSCPLCGESIATEWFGERDWYRLWDHWCRRHARREPHPTWDRNVRCVCGVPTTARRSDSAQRMSLLIRHHLWNLTPDEIKRHRVLYEMGLRIEEITE